MVVVGLLCILSGKEFEVLNLGYFFVAQTLNFFDGNVQTFEMLMNIKAALQLLDTIYITTLFTGMADWHV